MCHVQIVIKSIFKKNIFTISKQNSQHPRQIPKPGKPKNDISNFPPKNLQPCGNLVENKFFLPYDTGSFFFLMNSQSEQPIFTSFEFWSLTKTSDLRELWMISVKFLLVKYANPLSQYQSCGVLLSAGNSCYLYGKCWSCDCRGKQLHSLELDPKSVQTLQNSFTSSTGWLRFNFWACLRSCSNWCFYIKFQVLSNFMANSRFSLFENKIPGIYPTLNKI